MRPPGEGASANVFANSAFTRHEARRIAANIIEPQRRHDTVCLPKAFPMELPRPMLVSSDGRNPSDQAMRANKRGVQCKRNTHSSWPSGASTRCSGAVNDDQPLVQNNAPYFQVAAINVIDKEGYEASGVDKVRDSFKANGGKLVGGGYNKAIAIDRRHPASNRFLILDVPE